MGDDDDDIDGLDESQAKRSNIDDLAALTDDESVERGRGAMNHTLLMNMDNDNISNHGLMVDNISQTDKDSHILFAKEKEHRIEDAMSAHSGSMVGDIDMNNMDIDEQSVHSHHVQFDLDEIESVNASVATTALQQRQEQITPPTSPIAMNKNDKSKKKKSKKNKKKKRKKKRFAIDKKIEFDRNELIESNIENAEF